MSDEQVYGAYAVGSLPVRDWRGDPFPVEVSCYVDDREVDRDEYELQVGIDIALRGNSYSYFERHPDGSLVLRAVHKAKSVSPAHRRSRQFTVEQIARMFKLPLRLLVGPVPAKPAHRRRFGRG